MATLSPEQIADLVLGVQNQLGKNKVEDFYTPLQEYYAMPKLIKNKKLKERGGRGIQFNARIATASAAQHTGLYANDEINVVDLLKQASIPWRFSKTNWAYDVQEVRMDIGPSAIVNFVEEKRIDAMISLAELMETAFWGGPADESDVLTPFGIGYWFQRNASEGFNGGNPAGFPSGCAGLNASTYPGWKNYTGSYAEITKDDLVLKMRRAFRRTKWKSPVALNDYHMGDDFSVCAPETVVETLESYLEEQNDNLGNDIASKDGRLIFRRVAVDWVPALDSDAQVPVYGINWGSFYPVTLAGSFMEESKPTQVAGKHTVYAVFNDTTWNICCKNRRRQWVLHYVAA